MRCLSSAYGTSRRGYALLCLVAAASWGAILIGEHARPMLSGMLVGGRYLDQGDVIRQQGRHDCGVAALAMILVHGGQRASGLDSLRELTARRGRGLSFAEIRDAAAARGLDMQGWHLSFNDLATISTPAIVHFPGHYLVLDSLPRADAVFLRDPASGRLRMTATTFARRWTGRILAVPGPDSRRGSRQFEIATRLVAPPPDLRASLHPRERSKPRPMRR